VPLGALGLEEQRPLQKLGLPECSMRVVAPAVL